MKLMLTTVAVLTATALPAVAVHMKKNLYRKIVLCGALCLASVSSAYAADYTCTPIANEEWNASKHSWTNIKGTDRTSPSAVRETHLIVTADHFATRHVLNTGRYVDRSEQYSIDVGGNEMPQNFAASIAKTSTIYGKWAGARADKPNLQMAGFLARYEGAFVYVEFLINTNTGWVGRFGYGCTADASYTPSAPPAPSTPDPTPAPKWDEARNNSKHVPFTRHHGGMVVTVMLAGKTLNMTVDTGATISSVTESIADQMIAAKVATEGPSITFTLADGSKRTERTIVLDSLTLAGKTISSVTMGVDPDGADPLLGLRELNAIGEFTVTPNELLFN